jgi:hypothetical protein
MDRARSSRSGRSAANTAFRRTAPGQARGPFRDAQRAISAAAGRRATSPSRRGDQTPIAPGKKVSDVSQGRPPDRALRLGRADPHLLLDPVGALRREAPAACGGGSRHLLPPVARVERRPDAERAPDVA